MSELIMQLSDVMRAEVRSLDQIAHNAANLATPGFRSERTVLSGNFLGQVTAGQATKTESSVVLRDGPINVSGIPTELALRGNGWFVIESASGPALTRDGRFRLDADGTLKDLHGHSVLGENGPITGLDNNFRVAADGMVSGANGAAVGKLLLVATPDPSKLRGAGDGLYHYAGELSAASGAAVIQGAYEGSNVDTAADMMLLMQTTRHIETLQRSMSAYDQLLNTGINQLGK